MFGLDKKTFVMVSGFTRLSIVNLLKCVSMNNQEYKVRPVVMNINSDEPSFYPYSIVNKCGGSCNNINNPYAKSCILDVVKNINIKKYLI